MRHARKIALLLALSLLSWTGLGCSGRTSGSGGFVRGDGDGSTAESGMVESARLGGEDQNRDPATAPTTTETPPPGSGALEAAPERPVDVLSGAGALERIHFGFDEYTLGPDARDTLLENAESLNARPDARIRIEGHCDERGTTEYNLALGERRAVSALEYLLDLGIEPERMSALSFGEERPLDARSLEAAWAANRRAEFVELKR